MQGHQCLLNKNKMSPIKNRYNHNFKNKFCICDQEYHEDQEFMISCIDCLDFFHLEHLNLAEEEVWVNSNNNVYFTLDSSYKRK